MGVPAYVSLMLPRATLVAVVLLAGCRRATSGPPDEVLAAPLDSVTLASDARLDSSGAILGSFVGEGTGRAMHLLSSDTAFIRALVARWPPDIVGHGDRSAASTRRNPLRLTHRSTAPALLVGSPLGHTAVGLDAVFVHAGSCGNRGIQAEMVVEEQKSGREPTVQGPVLGSFNTDSPTSLQSAGDRQAPPEPPTDLVRHLIERTDRVTDSLLSSELGGARRDSTVQLEVNTLADFDAADVTPFRAADSTIRYAVSLRTRRIAGYAGGDTLVAASVMTWDSAGRQPRTMFRPTLLRLRGGRLVPSDRSPRALYWRRLQPISDFAFQWDDLWLEQVDVREETVRWGIVQPHGNVVVAAAEVEGPCR